MTMWKQKKIAVLKGGVAKEREISLKTGAAIEAALIRRGYQVVGIDAGYDIVQQLTEHRPDVAFIALHGPLGEDGCIQGLLEWMRIPYTGSSVTASAVAMHKVLCKHVARELKIPVARDVMVVRGQDQVEEVVNHLPFSVPVMVKPSREGSTINMTVVRDLASLPQAIECAWKSDDVVLIEEFIAGFDVTATVLAGKALPLIEIRPKSGFYDYASKYTKGMTDYIVPARISDAQTRRLSSYAEAIFEHLECQGVARIDFMVQDEREFFLEVNTIPGMTETSLVPKSAAQAGIGFEDLCEQILNQAKVHIRV